MTNETATIPPSQNEGDRFRRRYVRVVAVGLALCIAGFITRTVWVNNFSNNNASHHTTEQRYFSETMLARPGDIIDRRGRLLATSVSAQGLYLIPEKIKSPRQTAQTLSTLFELDANWVSQAIKKHPKKSYLWLAHQLNPQQVKQVVASGLLQEEYGFQKEYFRCYPRGDHAAHLLGTKNINISGVSEGGIEESYFKLIQGEPGRRIFSRNRTGEKCDSRIKRVPQSGKTVVLTVDSEIQQFAEQGLKQLIRLHKPVGCSAIVMNPQTGEILASASFPTYDPNQPVAISHHAWRDQTISFLFEPDALLDPIIVAWGLEQGMIKQTDLFQVENRSQAITKKNVASILTESNSQGMQQIRERISKPKLFRAMVDSGLGRNEISALPGEQSGTLLPFEQWKGSASTLFSNQHIVTINPLQLITAYANITYGDQHIRPRYILKRVDIIDYLQGELTASNNADLNENVVLSTSVDNSHKDYSHQKRSWIVSTPLVGYVNRGSGKKARLHDYAVFGKGATSRKALSKRGTFSEEKSVCTFICGAPANHPQLLVLVVADQPTTGYPLTGDAVAAPIAAKILQQSLKYQHVPTFRSQVQAASEQKQ